MQFSPKTCRAKANPTYLRIPDWHATNYDDKTNVGKETGVMVNYDGINVYGDEVTTNIKGVASLLEWRYNSVTICCF
jgi:hypothetical protein